MYFDKKHANGYEQNILGTIFTRLGSQTLEAMKPMVKSQVSSMEAINYQLPF